MRFAGLLLSLVVVAGCSLDSPTVACSGPSDCRLPLVCCAGGLAVSSEGFTGPTCLSKETCVAGGGSYTAFFPEGAPCGRVAGAEPCAQGLSCCNKTLTCETEGSCGQAPVPPEVMSASPAPACGGDSDCAQGICCGISWTQRDGACRSVADCAQLNGILTPRPDAGLPPDAGPGPNVDAGTSPNLAEQICEVAYCDPAGPASPNTTQRANCKTAFETGIDALGRPGLTANQACLDAVTASRGLCRYVFHWRDTISPEPDRSLPVLPGDCYAPNLAQPLAGVACDNLVACGGVTDKPACVLWLGSLTHDTLVRLAEATACPLDADALGFAGQPLLGKCTEDSHCPAGTQCATTLAPGGVCTILGCNETGLCTDLGGVCEAGLCTQACNPRQQNVQARRAVKQACNARVFAGGLPSDLGCGLQPSGRGACLPGVDPASCPQGLEALAGPGYGPLPHGYQCAQVRTSTLALFSPCSVPELGGPNPCGQGVCVGPGPLGRCLQPCVSTPIGVDAPMCPQDQACMDDPDLGWGALGYCRLRCDQGVGCAEGTTCQQSWPASYCR